MLALIEPRHDDMAAFDEPQRAMRGQAGPAQYVRNPRAGGIDQNPRRDFVPLAFLVLQARTPAIGLALRGDKRRSGQDDGTARRRIARRHDRQPCIIDAAIGIDETRSGRA